MDQFLAEHYGTGEPQYIEKRAGDESDFLGRVMAHAFHQELNLIKQAQLLKEAQPPSAREIASALGAGGRGNASVQDVRQMLEDTKPAAAGGSRRAVAPVTRTPKPAEVSRLRRAWGAATKTRGRKAALIGGGAALAAGAGYGGYRGLKAREKRSADEEFAEIVEQRAYEHLEAAGLIEKQAGYEDFDTAVDRAALELLEANGYPVEWY